jgi:broad specificity phosphatase PhoE
MALLNKKKNIVLIRHAQTEENIKAIQIYEGILRIRKFQLPTWRQFSSLFTLSLFNLDSKVSILGSRQIIDMHMILRDDKFWDKQRFDLIVCSPLSRAKDTCNGILPIEREDMHVKIVVDLEEATPYEHIFSATLLIRIERFKKWLSEREEENILIIGHSQYFKKMLKLTTLMRNCDVWQADYSKNEGVTTYDWNNLVLLHRTELADMHPYDKLTSKVKEEKEGNGLAGQEEEEVYNDLNEDEPTCRICQVKYYIIYIYLHIALDQLGKYLIRYWPSLFSLLGQLSTYLIRYSLAGLANRSTILLFIVIKTLHYVTVYSNSLYHKYIYI